MRYRLLKFHKKYVFEIDEKQTNFIFVVKSNPLAFLGLTHDSYQWATRKTSALLHLGLLHNATLSGVRNSLLACRKQS